MTNPLLETHELPPFESITADSVVPGVKSILEENRKAITSLLSSQSNTWQTLIEPLQELDDKLHNAWSPVGHMNAVVNSDALREAYNTCLPMLTEYYTEMGQNQALFEAYEALKNNEEHFSQLSTAQKQVISHALRSFRLAGIALPEEQKREFAEISKKLSQLTSKFGENVLDATQAWSKVIESEDDLAGLPESALSLAKQQAESKDHEGYLLTLDIPSYLPVMMYCDNRNLRKEMYEAYSTRASECGPNANQFDNTAIMQEILALRHRKANLLGFANYAELSIETKMADSTEKVVSFLKDLGAKSKPQAENDLKELQVFAKQMGGPDVLEPWDMSYYSEKLKQEKYSLSDEELKPYFPISKVINGLFEVAKRLFNVEIEQQTTFPSWHNDVQFYHVNRLSVDGTKVRVASFYLDPYARENKRGGAWMDDCRVRWGKTNGEIQLPVAYLVCNFPPPVGDQPALLTHNDVETLFHEFGHGLHHMLTQIDVRDVSGINGVAWDAVELPSQFLENWCWEKEALNFISGHFETQEPLPQTLLDQMLAAKNYHSAMQCVRQIEFALFDFQMHLQYNPEQPEDIKNILNAVRKEVSVIHPPSWNRFQNSFSHIFAGGYAAGYYSYKWAEVLSADAFSKFEEDGVFNSDTGAQFRDIILANGGSQDAMDLFVQFRGREPDVQALLRHTGIEATA